MTDLCKHCQAALGAPDLAQVKDQVTLHHKAWGNSPAPYLGGPYAALTALVQAGLASRDSSGWYVPTTQFYTI